LDSCDEATDTVVNAPADALCTNGQFCDGAEVCDPVLDCKAGTPPTIDDGVACTDDTCDEVADVVVNTPNDGLCDNGLFCDGADICDALLDCQVGTPPVIDDGVACTDDSCDEATDTIVNTANDANCDDGQFCDGAETCNAVLDCQAGTPPVIDDGVACTVDFCDEPTDTVFNAPADALCDNGLFCDGSETCDPVLDCQAGTPPVIDDGVACTVDFCDEPTDTVFNAPQDAPCDNGVFCDGVETCDPVLDCQAGQVLDGVPCEDGNLCNGDDICEAGVCVHPNPLDCDDGNECTDQLCAPLLGCQYFNVPRPCEDGNLCNGDDICEASVCVHPSPLDCDDGNLCTDQLCAPLLGCQYFNNTRPCEDADACTDGDVCSGGSCQSGGPLDCDDGNSCTADSCDQVLGCAHDLIPDCVVVPTTPEWGLPLLGLMLLAAGATLLLSGRRREASR